MSNFDRWLNKITLLAMTVTVTLFAGCGKDQRMEMNRLKQVGIAIHSYLGAHGEFPTGIKDGDGKLLLSWRVQILPHLDEFSLYERFQLDEPWDSERNKPLLEEMPAVFGSTDGKSAMLSFSGKRPKLIEQISSGTSQQIFAALVSDNHAVNWTAPVDLKPTAEALLAAVPKRSFLAVMYDGHAEELSTSLDRDQLQSKIEYKEVEISAESSNLAAVSPITPEQERAIKDLGGLLKINNTYLHLNKPSLTDEDLQAVFELQNLKFLDLSGTQISDRTLNDLEKLKNLDSVNLSNTGITDAGLAALAELKKMRRVNVNHTQVTDKGIQCLCDLQQLTSLYANSTQITDKGLEKLGKLQKLIELQLNDTEITDQGLKPIEKLHKLEYLQLRNTQVSDAGLKHLSHLANLVRLDLKSCQVSDSGIKSLLSLKSLRFLDLSGTEVTDSCLKDLASMESLRSLDLSGTRITEDGLKRLIQTNRNLTSITVIDTSIAEETAEAIRAEFPFCAVILD